MMNEGKPVRVMVSPPRASSSENPYLAMLTGALAREGVDFEDFGGRRAVATRPDVIHIHWPEQLVDWDLPAARVLVRSIVVLSVLALSRARGTRIVWTAHNVRPHELPRPRIYAMYSYIFARLLSAVIVLSPSAAGSLRASIPGLRSKQFTVAPHGHYRTWYAPAPRRSEARRQLGLGVDATILLAIGLIRPYKNLPRLVDAFKSGQYGPDVELVIAGRVAGAGLEQALLSARDDSDHIHFSFGHVSDDDLSVWLGGSDVVVLPYASASVLNSGAAMLALSFDRPVVVPKTPAMEDLRAVVGGEWVTIVDGDASTAVEEALKLTRQHRPTSPDLSQYEWSRAATMCLQAYHAESRTRQRRRLRHPHKG